MADVVLPPDAPSRIARLLRHEIGDLLQSVYSTASVLASRLGPEQALERQLVAELKRRAEQLRVEVDAVVRLVSPAGEGRAPVDLAGHAEAAVARLRREQPALRVGSSPRGPALVWADPVTLSESLQLLLLGMSGRARAVDVRVEDGDPVRCRVSRDGPPVTDGQLGWLRQPFEPTQDSLLGLALAACAQAAAGAGGSIQALQEGAWFHVELCFPPVGSSVVSGR
ncbi:MAG: hypothetical protein ACRC33_03970 [Gemmataceae bacterium]